MFYLGFPPQIHSPIMLEGFHRSCQPGFGAFEQHQRFIYAAKSVIFLMNLDLEFRFSSHLGQLRPIRD